MDDPNWYENAIIYAVDIEKFRDSNGDGIGDLQGVIDKLDYLCELGVTCLWLLPFFPSPRRDNGYDIQDHYAVDPRFGTLDDLKTLIRRAGELGIQVLFDLVVNHTSDKHPWFEAARADARSSFRDYYVWSSAPPPPPPGEANMFPGQVQSVWTFDEGAASYYFHRFYPFEPDLNLANDKVREQIRDIVDFWLSFGFAGLRLDAAAPMIHEKGQPNTIPADPHQTLRELFQYVQERRPGTAVIGEVDVEPEQVTSFLTGGGQMNMFFNFYLANYMFLGMATGSAKTVERAFDLLPTLPADCCWANFLRNLDELDLERLSEEEREATMDVFAPQEDMRIFGRGIRRRLAPMLGNDRRRLVMAYSLLFSMPGAPVIIYGDELGMGEDLERPGRQAVRLPMQWSNSRNGGFSEAPKKSLAVTSLSEGPFRYALVNADRQRGEKDSLLNHVRALSTLRRTHSSVNQQSLRFLATGDEAVLAHSYNTGTGHLVMVHNFSDRTKEVRLGPIGAGRAQTELVFGNGELEERESMSLKMPPYGCSWITLDAL